MNVGRVSAVSSFVACMLDASLPRASVLLQENGRTFVVINQKGIDPPSLEMLAREAILGASAGMVARCEHAAHSHAPAAIWIVLAGSSAAIS